MSAEIDFIKKQLRLIYQKVNPGLKDLAIDQYMDAVNYLHKGRYKEAFNSASNLCKLSGTSVDTVITLFHKMLFAEDVVTKDSVVFVHKSSPYAGSLKKLATKLGFTVQEHQFNPSQWTKDYMISGGDKLFIPLKDKSGSYFTSEFVELAKMNPRLYYGALQMNKHHEAKNNVESSEEWSLASGKMITGAEFVSKSILEGGNFYSAINKFGERFYIVGENAVSETMAANQLDRAGAIELIWQELKCPVNKLLVLPQWTYHLDLQMAYLGRGQFIMHSFVQNDIDFGLDARVVKKVKETFSLLKEKFEESVVDASIKILKDNGFEVKKTFGCLFYLEDETDVNQLQYVPYCKSADGFDGALALMMNGIALDLGTKGRHFLVARCDLTPFKQQFERSLQGLGVDNVQYVDMLEAYESGDYFNGMLIGIWGATSVTEVAAFMNGSLRCQTSILSRELSMVHSPELSRNHFFKRLERLDLALPKAEKPSIEADVSLELR